jgi:hypothetical protein
MNISNPIEATTEISSNFGVLIGMLVVAIIFVVIIWILTQLQGRN